MAAKITTVEAAAASWFNASEKNSKFGAADTEPRGVFADIVAALVDDEPPFVPDDAQGWQLFSDMKGNYFAAKSLTTAANRLIRIANTDRKGLVEFAKYHGWA